MEDVIFSCRDVNLYYDNNKKHALKNINLDIYRNKVTAFIGPSGCGKSTLSNCINGIIPFSYKGEIKGSCKVAGVETSTSSIFKLSSKVGTVLQDSDAQFVGLSVGEDIAYALENNITPRKIMLEKVLQAATIVHMQDFLESVPYNLSGGQKQRVSLAGIMHDDVEILLFDEPLAALDPQMGNQAIELIDEIQKENNKTVLIIEHRLEDVLYRPVDRIILMNEGEIVSDTTPDKLLSEGKLHENGIREPLYLSALKMAGCDFTEEDHPSDIFSMNLDQYKDKVVSYFNEAPKAAAKTFGECLLEVNDVSFRYKNRAEKVLDHVSFKVYKGEKIAVIGKNGAGKSTIAKMICGVLRPDEGEIKINGENYLKYSIKEIGEKIGYVMQNPNQMLVKDIIKDEVSLGLKLHGYSEEEINTRIEEALKMCNLWPMRNWPVGVVSYGQKKRITIASILAMKPEVIILDEPTAGQDYKVYTEIMTFLEDLNKNYGITILFITHDMHLAIEYTDRAIVFAEGKCVGNDSVYKILSNNEIIEEANLKQTSLYTLARRVGLDPEKFIDSFIVEERRNKHES